MEARKLAARLLADHAHEGTFEVRFDDFDDLELLAQRFREANCEVEMDVNKHTLIVVVPKGALPSQEP